MYAPQATPRRPTTPSQQNPRSSAPLQGKPAHLRLHRHALVKRQQHQRLAEMRREALIKLSVNTVLIAVSVGALAKLIPSQWMQQTQLQRIQVELEDTEKRVERLRSDFHRSFDPSQAQALRQQQSYRVDPHQKQIVWTEPGTSSGIRQPKD